MEYRVLGPIEVADNGEGTVAIGGPLMRRLLAVLVLHADRVVPVDRLIEAIWGDNPPAAAESTLQTYVSRLRRAFGNDCHLVSRSSGYVLVTDGDVIDSQRFETALAGGRAALAGGDEERAVALLTEGLGLWRGRALHEFADEPWAQVDARRLEEERLVALEELAAARLAVGPANDVVPDLERLVAEQPLRERPLALLMTALYRGGRHAEALRVFQDHRTVMNEELGLETSTELRLLERQILDQDPSLAKSPVGRALRGYRLIEQIRGGDGSGETWLAVQPSVGREVVIKTIPASVANDPQFIRRFEAEAQIVAGLEHPHIVPMYDYWREAGGAYLVLRYLRGGTLASTLLARRSINDSLLVAGQIADALAAAHRHGVTHGDLCAGDVLLDTAGAAYVSDFAIGVAVGERPRTSDDVHALGLLLAEMLAAPQPLDRSIDAVDQLRRLRPELTAPVIDVVARATRMLADDHFASAAEMSDACDAARSPGSRRRSSTSVGDRNPYKGLRAFEESDAADFFGRDELVEELVTRLADGARFITVIGPSGSGKSSLVRAGLLPAVRRGAIEGSGSWFVTSMTPSDDPLAELAMAIGRVAVRPVADLHHLLGTTGGFGRAVRGALPDDGSELLLVVDQLEECFTVCRDEQSCRTFLEGLAHAAFDARSRLRIVTTLRADFYDRPLQYRAFAMLLDAGSLTVVPPSPEELEAAIVGPAGRAGVELESGLMSHLISDLGERPAALALLQFTMAELFDQRRSGMLTLDACRAIGGVTGALAHRADTTFASLADEQQQIARRVFCRLVVIGENGVDGSRRTAVDQVSSIDDQSMVTAVLDRFAEQRLLTFDRDPITRAPTVEIAHEALITAWPKLSAWIDEDRDALRMRREVEVASTHWNDSGRDDSDLLRGLRLAAAVEWSNTHPEMMGEVDREFIATGETRREQARAQARRSARRQRQWLAFGAAALIIAVVAGAVAVVQRHNLDNQRQLTAQNAVLADQQGKLAEQQGTLAQEQRTLADKQRTIADEQTKLADARRLSAQAVSLATRDRSLALLLAIEADNLNPSTEAGSALAASLTDGPAITTLLPPDHSFFQAISPDGRLVVMSDSAHGRARLYSRAPGGTLSAIEPGLPPSTISGDVTSAFDHTGTRLATLDGRSGSLRIFDVSVPSHPREISEPVEVAGRERYGVEWNMDSSLVATGGSSGASVFRIEGDQPVLLRMVPGCAEAGCSIPGVSGLAFSPSDPSLLAVKTLFGPARLVDVATSEGTTLTVQDAGFACCYGVGFSPKGDRVAVAMGDAGIAIFDSGTGELLRTLPVKADLSMWLSFNADGSRLASADQGGNVSLWNTSDWRRIASVQAGVGPTYQGGFAPDDGQLLVSGQALVALDIENPPLLDRTLDVRLKNISAVVANSDGSRLFVGHDGGLAVVDSTSGEVASEGGDAVTALGPGSDDSSIVVGRKHGRVELLDPRGLGTILEVGDLKDQIYAVAIRGGGDPMVAAATIRHLTIWRIENGASRQVLDYDFGESIGIPSGIAFARDGSMLAANFNGGMAVIDMATLQIHLNPPSAGTGGPLVADPLGRPLFLAVIGASAALVDTDLTVNTPMPATGTAVISAAFSPDGSLAVTGGTDGSIAVLDVESSMQYGSFIRAPFGKVQSLTFLPHSKTLVTAHPDINGTSTIGFWNLDPDFLVQKACEVAGRDLTDAEWETYIPGYDHKPVCSA